MSKRFFKEITLEECEFAALKVAFSFCPDEEGTHSLGVIDEDFPLRNVSAISRNPNANVTVSPWLRCYVLEHWRKTRYAAGHEVPQANFGEFLSMLKELTFFTAVVFPRSRFIKKVRDDGLMRAEAYRGLYGYIDDGLSAHDSFDPDRDQILLFENKSGFTKGRFVIMDVESAKSSFQYMAYMREKDVVCKLCYRDDEAVFAGRNKVFLPLAKFVPKEWVSGTPSSVNLIIVPPIGKDWWFPPVIVANFELEDEMGFVVDLHYTQGLLPTEIYFQVLKGTRVDMLCDVPPFPRVNYDIRH